MRTGLAVLSVAALVGSDTIAWGHGSVAGGSDRVHTCLRGTARRTLRVVTDAQTCTGSETGLDFPHNGTFIGVNIGAPVNIPFDPANIGDTTGPITVQCPADPPPPDSPTHRVVGVTISQATDLALTVSRLSSPTTWEVAFAAPTTGAKTVTVAPLCVRLFQQL